MRDALKSYLALASGVTDLTRQAALAAARALVNQGEATAEQVTGLAEDLLAQTRQNREAVVALVSHEVDRALGRVGLASADEVVALTQRVRELEGQLQSAAATVGAATAQQASGTAPEKRPGKRAPARGRSAAGGGTSTEDSGPVTRSAAKKAATTKAVRRRRPAAEDQPTSDDAAEVQAGEPAPPASQATGTQSAAEKPPVGKPPAEKPPVSKAPAKVASAEKAPGDEAPEEHAPVEKAAAKRAPAKQAPAKKAPAKKAPAKKAPAKKAPAKKAPAKSASAEQAPVQAAGQVEADGSPAASGDGDASADGAPRPRATRKAPSARRTKGTTAATSDEPAPKGRRKQAPAEPGEAPAGEPGGPATSQTPEPGESPA